MNRGLLSEGAGVSCKVLGLLSGAGVYCQLQSVDVFSGAEFIVRHWACVCCQLLGRPLLSGAGFAGNDVEATQL